MKNRRYVLESGEDFLSGEPLVYRSFNKLCSDLGKTSSQYQMLLKAINNNKKLEVDGIRT
jgi:hypothetical protein